MPGFDPSQSEILVAETVNFHQEVDGIEGRHFSLGSAAAGILSGAEIKAKFSSDEEYEEAIEALARMASKVSGIPYDET